MATPELSIVLPTYQRPEVLRQTLASLRQETQIACEVLIYDNSPAAAIPDLADNEHYNVVGRNLGAAARNLGIQDARAPYILMLDDDSHPLPGAMAATLDVFRRQPADIAALMGAISRPDGSRETSLLPTVHQGCGAMFRTDVLRGLGEAYPKAFCFYGEEYWLALRLCRDGYRMRYCPELKVLHRTRREPDDKRRIFYFLARNNKAIWEAFAPPGHIDPTIYDSTRRYRLLARKEGVGDAFADGLAAALSGGGHKPLSKSQFRQFILLDRFDRVCREARPQRVVLCGCGKFPSLWADYLRCNGVERVRVADFNEGLIGQHFQRYPVLPPAGAVGLAQAGWTCLLGHSSQVDTERWREYLGAADVPARAVVGL